MGSHEGLADREVYRVSAGTSLEGRCSPLIPLASLMPVCTLLSLNYGPSHGRGVLELDSEEWGRSRFSQTLK